MGKRREFSAADLERGIERYLEGDSLRAASDGEAYSRELLRQELVRRGLIRERLQLSNGVPVGRFRTDRDWEKSIMSRVKKQDDGCWRWTGFINNKGYGMCCFRGRSRAAHRAVYEMLVGPVPDGLDCCHTCDNPKCVNPSHIFIGTRTDNMRDAARKGRTARGERAGNSVLTDVLVRDIRRRARGGEDIREIAGAIGVPWKTVWSAASCRTWRHI